jgi:hypothetical protein
MGNFLNNDNKSDLINQETMNCDSLVSSSNEDWIVGDTTVTKKCFKDYGNKNNCKHYILIGNHPYIKDKKYICKLFTENYKTLPQHFAS